MIQAAVIFEYDLWAAKKGGRVSGTTQVEVDGELFRPDAITDTKHRRTYIEVEKSSSIKRRNKVQVPELSAHLFYKKLDYLTRSGDVLVWLWTRKWAIRYRPLWTTTVSPVIHLTVAVDTH